MDSPHTGNARLAATLNQLDFERFVIGRANRREFRRLSPAALCAALPEAARELLARLDAAIESTRRADIVAKNAAVIAKLRRENVDAAATELGGLGPAVDGLIESAEVDLRNAEIALLDEQAALANAIRHLDTIGPALVSAIDSGRDEIGAALTDCASSQLGERSATAIASGDAQPADRDLVASLVAAPGAPPTLLAA